jgi:hypothetical protein
MPTLKKPGQRWFFKGLSPQFFLKDDAELIMMG